jgi:cytoskeletal protein CcmA (bactofilin family)
MSKTRLMLGLVITLLFFSPISVLAFTTKAGDAIGISREQTVDGSYYAAGNTIIIDGHIKGDLICAAQTVTVNGQIDGDLICAVQTININGPINGNLRTMASSISLNGRVGKNITVAAANLTTSASSTIGGDLLSALAFADLRGKISGDLAGVGASYTLAGDVLKNVKLKIDSKNSKSSGLKILGTASVGGNVNYTDSKEAQIDKNAKIKGKIVPNIITEQKHEGTGLAAWLWMIIYMIIACWIVGLVLVMVWPDEIKRLIAIMREKGSSAFGWGTITLLIMPPVLIILMVTLVGIPLALLLALTWIIGLAISRILVAILLGQWLLQRYAADKKNNLLLAMFIGVFLAIIIFSIPFIGWLLAFAATIWGLGGIVLFFKKA